MLSCQKGPKTHFQSQFFLSKTIWFFLILFGMFVRCMLIFSQISRLFYIPPLESWQAQIAIPGICTRIWSNFSSSPLVEIWVHFLVLRCEAMLVKNAKFVFDPLDGKVKDCARKSKSLYITRWAIFMEQNLRIGLVFGWLSSSEFIENLNFLFYVFGI